MYRYILIIIFAAIGNSAFSQIREELIMLRTKDCDIHGTLTLPKGEAKKVVLIVADAGPMDRNCNQSMFFRTDAYKMYALALAQNNIASVRFDKRGVGASRIQNFDQSKLRLSMYVDDVKGWVELLRKRFPKVIIAGHSEGSLLGIAAIAEGSKADALLSISGIGRKLDLYLKDQLSGQPVQIRDIAYGIIDSLSAGKMVEDIPVFLRNHFHHSLQPYIMSMFIYDPSVLMREVKVPTMIIHGDTDIQVKVEDAKELASVNPKAKLVLINGMNHFLKDCPTMDREMQLETYTNPAYQLNSKLIVESVKFIESL